MNVYVYTHSMQMSWSTLVYSIL